MRAKKLEKELKYLTPSERQKEVEKHKDKITDKNVKTVAREIYLKRGIEYRKLNGNMFDKLGATLSDLGKVLQNRDNNTRNKMIVDALYMVILIVLMKVPFDLVRDIGYDYLSILCSNSILEIVWYIFFLLLYTIVLICTLIILIRNFIKKYHK